MTVNFKHQRAKPRWLALLVLVGALLALAVASVQATTIPSNYVFIVEDADGANDVPGQVDLTQMARDDTTASTYKLFWSWDSISAWTGQGQTGDACALFDTDTSGPGLGNIDYVVCVRVENFNADPTDVRIRPSIDADHPAFVFSCSDKKNDRCTNPAPVTYTPDQLQAGALGSTPLDPTANLITDTDPFDDSVPNGPGESYPYDSTVEIHILKALIPGTEVLTNVCSYPSAGNGGNNNPFDCIVNPGGGFLIIKKDAGTGVTSPNFTFDIATVQGTTASLVDTRTIAGTGTAQEEPLPIGSNVRVTETNIDSAWSLTAISCKLEDGTTPTGTVDLTNYRVSGVQIESGKFTTCTFTDALKTGTLVVIKHVINDNGGSATAGQFSYSLGDGSAATNEAGAESPGKSYTRNVGTTYAVQENSGGPSGYSVSYSTDCSGSIVAGTTKTCTITNDDNAPALHLRKTVTNDNGGSALATAWTLTATGTGGSPSNLSGSTPVDSGSSFKADTYALGESGPANYTAGAWNCGAATMPDATHVTVPLGGNVTCTITNDDNAPALHLRKTVTNDNGGSALATAWTLTATGTGGSPSNLSGSTPVDSGSSFKADTYALGESGPANYTAGAWNCGAATMPDATHVTVPLGGNVTCTITNDDNAPALHLRKTVTNDNGGSALATAWTLTATGTGGSPSNLSGSTPVDSGSSFKADTYALGESGPANYTAGAWNCGAATMPDATHVTVPLGGNVTCTITNDDNAPALHLRKTVTNDNGGSALATAWTLTATGTGGSPSNLSGSTPVDSGSSFKADTYALGESGPANYTAGAWNCGAATMPDATHVTVPLGGNVTCTINNDDNKAQPDGSTTQSWVLHDSLTITGIRPGAPVDAEHPAASVDFYLYSDDACSVEVGNELDRPISAGVASTEDGIAVSQPGFYYWTAFYSGDQYNEAFDTNCNEVTLIQADDNLDDNQNGLQDFIDAVITFLGGTP